MKELIAQNLGVNAYEVSCREAWQKTRKKRMALWYLNSFISDKVFDGKALSCP
jgi:hypothetical protein